MKKILFSIIVFCLVFSSNFFISYSSVLDENIIAEDKLFKENRIKESKDLGFEDATDSSYDTTLNQKSNQKYYVRINSANLLRGTVIDYGFVSYNSGEVVTIEAFPKSGYEFSHWESSAPFMPIHNRLEENT